MRLPEEESQSLTELSPLEARVLPSGAKVTQFSSPDLTYMVRKGRPVAASQILIAPSPPPR